MLKILEWAVRIFLTQGSHPCLTSFLTQGSHPCLTSPALAGRFFTTSTTWEASSPIKLQDKITFT